MLPIASEIAVRLTRDEAQSALPNAPVRDGTAQKPTPRRHRARAAKRLHRLAARLEQTA